MRKICLPILFSLAMANVFAGVETAVVASAENPPLPESPPLRTKPTNPDCVPPTYPRSALRNEEAGFVRVGLLVDVDGTVVDSQILKSSSFKSLDNETLQTFQKCKYAPPVENGQPVKGWIQIHYRWVLE